MDRTTLLMSLDQSSEKSINDAIVFLEQSYIRILKALERNLKDRKIGLAEFYRGHQWIHYCLEDLDRFSIKRNYEQNMRRKKDGKRSLK